MINESQLAGGGPVGYLDLFNSIETKWDVLGPSHICKKVVLLHMGELLGSFFTQMDRASFFQRPREADMRRESL